MSSHNVNLNEGYNKKHVAVGIVIAVWFCAVASFFLAGAREHHPLNSTGCMECHAFGISYSETKTCERIEP